MNLKDRLENIKQTNDISIKEETSQNNYLGVSEIFADSSEVRNLFLNLVHQNKNIIFSCDKSIDNLMVAFYLQSLLGEDNSEIINRIDENIENINFRKNIVPEPDITEVVKIFEYIIYGYKSFIFGVNLGNSDNALEKIKTLIALNFKNLTDSNINTLIGSADAVLVFLSKNEDGLFYVSKIDEILYVNGELSSETLFSYSSAKNTVPAEETVLKQNEATIEIELEEEDIKTDSAAESETNIEVEAEFENISDNTAANEIQLTDKTENTEKFEAEEKTEEFQAGEITEDNSATVQETEKLQTSDEPQEIEKLQPAAEVQQSDEFQNTEGIRKTEELITIEELPQSAKLQQTEQKEPTAEIEETDVPKQALATSNEETVAAEKNEQSPADISGKKINKYKLLKEKIRNKKADLK